jgi:hypothetical protein
MVLSEVLYGIKLKSVLGLIDIAVSSIIFELRADNKNRNFVTIKNNTQSSLKRNFGRTNRVSATTKSSYCSNTNVNNNLEILSKN